MTFKRCAAAALTTLVFTLPSTSFADKEKPVSIRLDTGFIFSGSADNLNPDGSNKYLADLDSSADMEYTFLPIILPTAEWDVGQPGEVVLFFNGKRRIIDSAGGLIINIGASYTAAGTAAFELNLFSSFFDEVWENPYLTGEPRSSSDTTKYGLSLAAKDLFDSGFGLTIAYMDDDVEDDLLAEELPQLARDGSVYALKAEYSHALSSSLSLGPQLTVIKGDYDGESSSYSMYTAGIQGTYRHGRLSITPEIYYGNREFDQTNPVFDRTREEDIYGLKAMLFYRAPFGLQDWSLVTLLGYEKGESSIAFHDTEATSFGMFLSYSF